jgi:hypothetical protein
VAIRVSWTGVDRDALLSALEQSGLEPSVVDREGETVIEIPCEEGDVARLCDDVVAQVETVLGELELPLVPEKADNQVYIRPPAA